MHYHTEERDEFIRHLASLFPKCFAVEPVQRRPLKNDIINDLEKQKVLDREKLLCALDYYQANFTYCYTLIAGAERVDLDGRVVGKVTEREAAAAKRFVHERKQDLAERRTARFTEQAALRQAVAAPVVVSRLTNGATMKKANGTPPDIHPVVARLQSDLTLANSLLTDKQYEQMRPALATAALRQIADQVETLIDELRYGPPADNLPADL